MLRMSALARKASHNRHPLDASLTKAVSMRLRARPCHGSVGRRRRPKPKQMKASGFNTFIARVDAAEYNLCRKLNRGASHAFPRRLFQAASRLGDGVIWYLLILGLPVIYGPAALKPAVVMALTGIVGLVIYKCLKRVFVRERPFITHTTIDLAMAPLDRYSFPSGHTLHAVCFTWQMTAHFPELGWVLVPLAALISGSRVVLGLHYPTDVLAGGAIGAFLGALATSLVQ